MATFNVSTAVDLLAAVKAAKAGDEIKLAAGDYGVVSLKGIIPAGTVKISSADPLNPAVFSGLTISGSSNLSLSNLKMVIRFRCLQSSSHTCDTTQSCRRRGWRVWV